MTDAAGETASAEAYWGARADEYDGFIVRVVPRYREMLERLLDHSPERAARVLELGTGTGNVSLLLAQRWPDAAFTFVDGAPEMLDVVRERLHAHFPSVAASAQFRAERFEELQLERASVDLVVASLSLHHVADVGAVYDRIGPAVTARGRLLMLDGLRGETDADHATHMARWRAYWEVNLSADERRDVAAHVEQHDHYRTFAEHIVMLRAAGFAQVDCIWRDGIFTLVTATKAN